MILEQGQRWVVVRYGNSGEQLAIYKGLNRARNPVVRKWLANSRRWTAWVWIPRTHLLRDATGRDLSRKNGPLEVPS